MIPDKVKIEAIIKELKPILRLMNWEIDFDFCDEYRMKDLTGDGDNLAACSKNLNINYAHIYMKPDGKQAEDWYNTLVHELYHLVTSDWKYHASSMLNYVKDEAAHDKENNMLTAYYEQATDSLARIFCTVYPVTNFNHILEG